ncbi:MAG: serine/threonine protein kinase [Acidobacteriota bacterium]
MNQILETNQIVRTSPSALQCRVLRLLGGGGQGEVYLADLHGKLVALKWYRPIAATPRQQTGLEELVRKGSPDERFLWPLELAFDPQTPGFGYVMLLREPRFKSLYDLMKCRIAPSFRTLATVGLSLSDAFLRLHSQGLCYRDINFGNVFFDPDTGEVLICDNDNVAVDGEDEGVLGTPRFMAPEIVRGDARPTSQSDLFSLAVLLFYIFMVHHPLEGAQEASIKALDAPAMKWLYGTKPVFIFDPVDRCNAPVPGLHDNAVIYWSIYPQFFRDLFTKAFTDGIRDPRNGRVRESEWRATMVRLRDSIVYCPACNEQNFYDGDALKASGGKAPACWACQKEVRLPPRIRIGKSTIVMLNHDTRLFPHHVDDRCGYDFSEPIAEVAKHPTDARIWGLKNVSKTQWTGQIADGTTRDVPPGRSVTLAAGTRINFGQREGEIRV